MSAREKLNNTLTRIAGGEERAKSRSDVEQDAIWCDEGNKGQCCPNCAFYGKDPGKCVCGPRPSTWVSSLVGGDADPFPCWCDCDAAPYHRKWERSPDQCVYSDECISASKPAKSGYARTFSFDVLRQGCTPFEDLVHHTDFNHMY